MKLTKSQLKKLVKEELGKLSEATPAVIEKDEAGWYINEALEDLEDALKKDNILYEKDKILLYKLYKKIKEEFLSIDKSKL